MGWPQSEPVVDATTLSILMAKTRLHLGFVLGVGAAVLVWLFMDRRTVWGFEIRAVGAKVTASRFAGMPLNAAIVRTALISDGLAAMAGGLGTFGCQWVSDHRLLPGLRLHRHCGSHTGGPASSGGDNVDPVHGHDLPRGRTP